MNTYAVNIRRRLHMHPGVGFDLDETLAILRGELDQIGVEYTERYGKSSIVATVNPEKTNFTIGIRADIDALPIQEENDVEYRSRNDGKMHACGHDAHGAIALTALKRLYEMRDSINCRVKVLFQSAEEYNTSGAKLMVDDGVMNGIDCIVALHCDPKYDAGTVAISANEQGAISDGFRLEFYGKSAHVANQEKGVDAIMMAVRAYTSLEMMVAKEFPAREPLIFNVGAVHGGVTNNVIADSCSLFCTLRTYREDLAEKVLERVRTVCEAVATSFGGSFRFVAVKHYPNVCNDEVVTEKMRMTAERVVGKDRVFEEKRTMGGEDFSYMTIEKPGCMFRLGVRNEERGIVSTLHQCTFDIDERALEIGVNMFVQFILDHMNGIADLPQRGHRS